MPTKMEVIQEIRTLEKEGGLSLDQSIKVIEIQEKQIETRKDEQAQIKEYYERQQKDNPNIEITALEMCKQAGVPTTSVNVNYARSLKSRLAITHRKEAAE